jgi:glucose/arabinose dehydrogenase
MLRWLVLGAASGLGALLPISVLAQGRMPACAPDNAGLTLPPGFCALVVADSVTRARHLVVASNGDVFVATPQTREWPGGVVALRDTTGDGVADVRRRFGSGTGDDVRFYGGSLYYSTNDAVLRYPFQAGALEPAGPPDTVVKGLPADRSHRAKPFAIGPRGELYVNIGSPSNACQVQDRTQGSPGKDPCPELETRAGIWRFDAQKLGQTQADGIRFATGMRNSVALALNPKDGRLYAVIHGRDQLGQNWPSLYTEAQSAEKPAEEFVRVEQGDDYGWPYCFYDPELELKVLAPEYGGDGRRQDRCAQKRMPLIAFPAHWAPNGLLFYQGAMFPERYRGGAFIAFHGSWNRAPLPQGGYAVVFAPFAGSDPTGQWEIFADGFAGVKPIRSPGEAQHRPVGLAEGPDGSLYVSDDQGGRIYRIVYRP